MVRRVGARRQQLRWPLAGVSQRKACSTPDSLAESEYTATGPAPGNGPPNSERLEGGSARALVKRYGTSPGTPTQVDSARVTRLNCSGGLCVYIAEGLGLHRATR